MPARPPSTRLPRRALRFWAAVSALALLAFLVEINGTAAPQPAPQVVPALK